LSPQSFASRVPDVSQWADAPAQVDAGNCCRPDILMTSVDGLTLSTDSQLFACRICCQRPASKTNPAIVIIGQPALTIDCEWHAANQAGLSPVSDASLKYVDDLTISCDESHQ
jgi:hypothetical protein